MAAKLGRLIVSVLWAMALVTPVGLVAQRSMTYELLGVDGGFAAWCLALLMLIVIGMGVAVLIAAPCFAIISSLGLDGIPKAIAFCGLATAATAGAHRAVVRFGTTAPDHLVPIALALLFHGVLYAVHYRGSAAITSKS